MSWIVLVVDAEMKEAQRFEGLYEVPEWTSETEEAFARIEEVQESCN